MASPPRPDFTDEPPPRPDAGSAPLHGFQGDRGPAAVRSLVPPGLAIALSREAGSRGANIARRTAKRLGWQIYDQELLDYIAREGSAEEATSTLSPALARWAAEGAARCAATGRCSPEPAVLDLVGAVFGLAAAGNVVFLGRGAGWILPRESTLHVRIVAPEADRIAFLSQGLRMPLEDAARQLRHDDTRRRTFLEGCLHAAPDDPHAYDLVLNSGMLGEDLCVELILRAAAVKQSARV